MPAKCDEQLGMGTDASRQLSSISRYKKGRTESLIAKESSPKHALDCRIVCPYSEHDKAQVAAAHAPRLWKSSSGSHCEPVYHSSMHKAPLQFHIPPRFSRLRQG